MESSSSNLCKCDDDTVENTTTTPTNNNNDRCNECPLLNNNNTEEINRIKIELENEKAEDIDWNKKDERIICSKCGLCKKIPLKIPFYGPYTFRDQIKRDETYYYCTCGKTTGQQPFCDKITCVGTEFRPIPFTPGRQQSLFLMCGCRYTKNPPYCDASHTGLQFNPQYPPYELFKETELITKHFDFNKPVRIFSGMQPTSGSIHLGNYVGAMLSWVDLQNRILLENSKQEQTNINKHSLMFSIVDLHSLTSNKTITPEQLCSNTLNIAATYVACGIDPDKVILFNQSMVPGHSELCWILNCLTPISRLNMMTQFKDKSKNVRHEDAITNGLLSYPVLMAADILLYKTTHVPVGEDQTQHIELTKKIANSFNNFYKTPFFPSPQLVISEQNKRIMSLLDGHKKMSKSDPLIGSRIDLTDSEETIRHKIKRSKSDHIQGISYDPVNRPEISNLLAIASSMTGEPIESIVNEFHSKNNSQFKEFLSESIIKKLGPIKDKFQYLQSNPNQIRDILHKGAQKANAIANENLKQIKDIVGLFN
eukprot:gene1251-1578_t